MPATKLIDNEFLTMWYYPEDKIIHHQFHQFLYGQAFQDALSKGAAMFEKEGGKKWLSDDRKNGAVPPEDQAWAQTNWFPRVKNAGLKYWALVMPEKAIGQMNMQRFVKQYSDQGITVQVFGEPDLALKWLKSV